MRLDPLAVAVEVARSAALEGHSTGVVEHTPSSLDVQRSEADRPSPAVVVVVAITRT